MLRLRMPPPAYQLDMVAAPAVVLRGGGGGSVWASVSALHAMHLLLHGRRGAPDDSIPLTRVFPLESHCH